MSQSDLEPITSVTSVGAMTGSAETEKPIFVAPRTCTILGIDLLDNTAIAAHSSNYGIATVYRKGAAGTSSVLVATKRTSSVGIAAHVPFALTLTTTTANLTLDANEALTFKWTENGTGQDLTAASVAVHYVLGTRE